MTYIGIGLILIMLASLYNHLSSVQDDPPDDGRDHLELVRKKSDPDLPTTAGGTPAEPGVNTPLMTTQVNYEDYDKDRQIVQKWMKE